MQKSVFKSSFSLLLTRRFGTFWFASLLSNIGTWAQQVAQPWLLLSLGASPFLLGLDTFAMGAPVLLLTLVGGALADRSDRRSTIVFFQSIQMWCPIVLVALLLTGLVQPWIVILLSLVVGITDALSMPSFQSIVPSIVEHEEIPYAIALNSTQFNLSRILGPSIAGVLMINVGAAGAFAVNAASYVPFLLVAMWVLPRTAKVSGNHEAISYAKLKASVNEVLRQPMLRGALQTVLVTSSLCAPIITFCPVLVRDVFQGDAKVFSITVVAFGVGGLIGAMGLLGVHPGRDRRALCSAFALAYALVVILSALNQWRSMLAALFVLAGIAMTASNASANALLQVAAPAAIRGQTVSLFMLAMRGGLAIGSLITGVTVNYFGVRYALLINGLLALLAHGWVAILWARVRPVA